MTKERLQKIKDSIDFQLEVAEHIKAVSVIECLNEEKELYNYVIELENMRKEAIKALNDDEYSHIEKLQTVYKLLNKTNKE